MAVILMSLDSESNKQPDPFSGMLPSFFSLLNNTTLLIDFTVTRYHP